MSFDTKRATETGEIGLNLNWNGNNQEDPIFDPNISPETKYNIRNIRIIGNENFMLKFHKIMILMVFKNSEI